MVHDVFIRAKSASSGKPSALGLFHLLGNVFEWCLDVRLRNVRRKGDTAFPRPPA
jgi:formylglycine-generating enzyme required for sulfatase activity